MFIIIIPCSNQVFVTFVFFSNFALRLCFQAPRPPCDPYTSLVVLPSAFLVCRLPISPPEAIRCWPYYISRTRISPSCFTFPRAAGGTRAIPLTSAWSCDRCALIDACGGKNYAVSRCWSKTAPTGCFIIKGLYESSW